MLSSSIKAPVTKFITPLCKGLLRIGVTPNFVTALGTLLSAIASVTLIPTGHLFAACMFITVFVLFDLLDGTMARLSQRGVSNFGALLDSTLDRVADGGLLLSLAWYLHREYSSIEALVYLNILLGFLVSYIRARAESLNIECSGGLAERTERLIITLSTIGLAGIGIPYVLALGIWTLFVLSLITVIQRFLIVYRAEH